MIRWEKMMPNYVINLLTFDSPQAREVVEEICTGEILDFEKLVPSPPHKYRGPVDEEEIADDFPCNWYSWNIKNWGTKWNASCGIVYLWDKEPRASLVFDTAWYPPWPVMAAFANRYKIPFTHSYFEEFGGFWGIDVWSDTKESEMIQRVSKLYCRPQDFELLKDLALLRGGDQGAEQQKKIEEVLKEICDDN